MRPSGAKASHTLAGNGLELRHRRQGEAARLRLANDGLAERML